MYRYRIGDLQLRWAEGSFPLVQDEFMRRFTLPPDAWDPAGESVVYESAFYPLDSFRTAPLLHKNETYELYETERGPLIVYHWATCRFGFAYWLDDLKRDGRMTCYFNPKMEGELPLAAVRFFSCAGLHSKLLQRGGLILHASYVGIDGAAVCFTAPSGTGKSTQAELWRRYAGAEIINGDRALLRRRGDIWYAHGYPCCGSSDICVNRSLPLATVVVLEQGTENRVVRLRGGQQIRALVSGSEFFLWDQEEIDAVFRLAAELASSVPVVKLTCRPDGGAVDTLKRYLEGQYATDL